MNFPRRTKRDNQGRRVVEELWDQDAVPNLHMYNQPNEERAMDRNTVAKRLSQLFSKSDVHRRAAHAAFDDAGRYVDDMHDRHRMPSREQVNPGMPTGASGDGAFEMQEHYSDDVQRGNVSEEYQKFSELLDGLGEQLKAVQEGQRVLASVFHNLLKGDEITDDDDEDEVTSEEAEKALAYLQNGGQLPDGLNIQTKSMEQILLTIAGQSKGKSTPPDLRVRKSVPLHQRLEASIADAQESGTISLGESMEASSLVNRMQAAQRGEIVKSIFGDSLRRTSPAVRNLFAAEGIKATDERFVEGI